MTITIDIDDLMEEVQAALINEWQHLDIDETGSEAVYSMIKKALATFKSKTLPRLQLPTPQSQPPKR